MAQSNEYLKQIGESIRKLRDRKKMSQQELADYAGISKRMLQYIEAGTSNPTILMLDAISQSLGTTVEHLIKKEINLNQGNK